jgi:dTDP-4-amino-4,6-dideoxygalactose transaminase
MSLRFHGKGKDKYENIRIGLNSRLDTIQAAILIEKLKEFPTELENRNKLANYYSRKFSDKYITPYIPNEYQSSWAQYTIQTENRENAQNYFKELGMPTLVYYKRCMHAQPALKYLNNDPNEFPVAENLSKTVLSLPMHGYFK